MTTEVSTDGRKTVSALMSAFNSQYPYLNIRIYRPEGKAFADKDTLKRYQCDINKTLSEIRTKKGSGEISFLGSKKVKTIESEFELLFGLYVQIGYTDKDGWMKSTTNEENELSLAQLNEKCGQEHCKKNVWLDDEEEQDKADLKALNDMSKELRHLARGLLIQEAFDSYSGIISILLYHKLHDQEILELAVQLHNSLIHFPPNQSASFSKEDFRDNIMDCFNDLKGKTISQKMTSLSDHIELILDGDLYPSSSDVHFGKKIISILYADIKEILLFSGGINESKDYLEVMERAIQGSGFGGFSG